MTDQILQQNQNNDFFQEMTQTNEERLGPPKIDWTGILLMTLVALFCGFLTSVSVLISAFFTLGRFSLESGVSPMILSMIAMFALWVASMIYIWAARTLFPYVYTRNRILYVQVSVFTVLLYICMMPIYLIVSSQSGIETSNILYVYLVHILLTLFGLELLSGMITQYRYILLSFYANIISLILTSGLVFWFFKGASDSEAALFILMGISMIAFTLFTFLTFFIKYLYYTLYISTGKDMLGNVFWNIEEIEKASLKTVEKELLNS